MRRLRDLPTWRVLALALTTMLGMIQLWLGTVGFRFTTTFGEFTDEHVVKATPPGTIGVLAVLTIVGVALVRVPIRGYRQRELPTATRPARSNTSESR